MAMLNITVPDRTPQMTDDEYRDEVITALHVLTNDDLFRHISDRPLLLDGDECDAAGLDPTGRYFTYAWEDDSRTSIYNVELADEIAARMRHMCPVPAFVADELDGIEMRYDLGGCADHVIDSTLLGKYGCEPDSDLIDASARAAFRILAQRLDTRSVPA